jgi:Holliday junction resolvase RusA-like endonuclease
MTVTSPMEIVDTSARPFGLPAEIILDLPPPPSVNRTRRVNWRGQHAAEQWCAVADKVVMATRRPNQPRKIEGPFDLHVTLSPTVRSDPDNGLKSLIDYLRRIEVIQNDSPKFFRRLTVEWGTAPEGVRVTVRACE